MSETTSPASATPNQPAGALSIADAAALMASRRTAAPAATTAPVAPEAPAPDETDKPEAAPVDVEMADSTDGDGEQPAEPEVEGADDDLEATGEPDGDYIELPDGTKIPVEEAVKAHQNFKALQARVTRKEQALAEERRALESERQKVNGELGGYLERVKAEAEQIAALRTDYAQRLDIVAKTIGDEDKRFGEVDWVKLADEDPVQANRLWMEKELHEKRKATIAQEQERVRQEQAQQMQRQIAEARGKFQAVVAEKYADLLDPEKGPSMQQAMLRTAADAGYTAQEIEHTLDPRALSLWYKATLYDRLVAQKTAATASPTAPKPDATGTIRVVKARAARPTPIPAPKAALGRAQAAYNAKPSMENALALMEAKRLSR